MRYLFLALLLWVSFSIGQEISLFPGEPAQLGSWAQVAQALRLYPTSPRPVIYEGPTLLNRLFGEIVLGEGRYTILLGVSPQNEVGLWVDFDEDSRLSAGERAQGTKVTGGIAWSFSLQAKPKGAAPYAYSLQVLWPEGRGYVFLVGGAPRTGFFQDRRVVAIDGDLDGVFGTKGDFFGIDVDGDGKIYAEADGHERFSLAEAFTIGTESFKLTEISGDGLRARVEPTSYVSPKVPLIPGSPAPNFFFRDFLTGQELSLRDLRGRVVLLDFWATWCPPCMASLPEVKKVYEEFHTQGFEIVGISLDESREDLERILKDYGISWLVAFEGKRWDNALANLYRVSQIPTTYLLDKAGTIRFRNMEGEELRKAVVELIGEGIEETSNAQVSTLPTLPAKAEPILEVHLPTEIGLPAGEETAIPVRIANISPYLAEEINFAVEELPAGVELHLPAPFALPAFGERTVTITFFVQPGAPNVFPTPIKLRLDYHYCIAEACFQMTQEAVTTLVLGKTTTRGLRVPWWLLLLLAAGVFISWFLWGKGLVGLSFFLFAIALAAMGFGVYLGQARQAQRIAQVLCTSCVGLAEAHPAQDGLSPELRQAFSSLTKSGHLLLFYTEWCRACPYAKNLLAEIASINPRIFVELVDADLERERAEAAGVIHHGKAVVPAVLVVETQKVLFGTEGLPTRLLAALREIP
ncbi:MAG: thioredoxin-like domain-containing protein [Candidatus Bipolaricaulota bacterium]|nr:thioredoxin-like domain-containing protein [Candidatus Bipolaricaulota bacterium]MDW8126187.1 thioredoxin-like domain-containing protein [Candidatus Bipolaricaulota bacterium]